LPTPQQDSCVHVPAGGIGGDSGRAYTAPMA